MRDKEVIRVKNPVSEIIIIIIKIKIMIIMMDSIENIIINMIQMLRIFQDNRHLKKNNKMIIILCKKMVKCFQLIKVDYKIT